ncbi:MAG TPA: TadE/TadG family type IV pilus assembly protein [Sphingomicrobium sp.]|jgi:Flp pilus assembly protein TadG
MSLLRNERGAAVVEMAMVAPVLALMTIGVIDMSNAYSKKLALEQGAQRAIEKIMNTTETSTVEATLANEAVCQVNGWTTSGGVTTCNTSPITTSNVTVTWRLDCVNGPTTLSQSTTDSSVYDGYVAACTGTKVGYVQVTVTDKYTPLFPIHFASFNGGDSTYHLSATAGIRTM